MDILQTELFRSWFSRLKDRKAKACIQVRLDRAEDGNFGDHKPVDGGVSEMAGDDVAFIAKALGNIARAHGMTQLAADAGMGRESLYKALSADGNPSFATILKVTRALGLRLHVEVAA